MLLHKQQRPADRERRRFAQERHQCKRAVDQIVCGEQAMNHSICGAGSDK